MAQSYDPAEIEPRWQRLWEERRIFRTADPGAPGFDPARPKYYVLDMFPYPSGSGLHVGHAVGYVATDIVARRMRMKGCNVLHPMGWDSFGLPAEQYAIQTGKHPKETTAENTANFRRQLQRIGLSFDWTREINTSDPRYYRWTQWIFARLWERGLAYQAEVPVWWCEELKTVLANEEVIGGRSERGNFPCVRRPQKQWMLKITAYAERLLEGLEDLDWPESVKALQRDWIGRSEGARIRFEVEGAAGRAIEVFTTRPDTLFGATYLVLAPEHPLVEALTAPAARAAVEDYRAAAARKSDLERSDLSREKTGVAIGAFGLNPLLAAGDPRARLPVWVADYVLAHYGTGAIMAVPAHDERDFDFARAHGLPVREVVRPPAGVPGLAQGACFSGQGTAVESPGLDGLATPAAVRRACELLEQRGAGQAEITYRLRDWLFSRQRYWGEPFPLLHRADGSVARVPDAELPVELPAMADFRPSSDGSPPLARAKSWVEARDPESGAPARRETDTMPGWAGSCWYWLRFMDPHNPDEPFSREAERYFGPVDLYVGGIAHATLHLLYGRFWHKVLHDLGLVHTSEPFQRLFNQGLITAFAYQDAGGRLVPSAEVEARGEGFARRGSAESVQQVVTKMAKSLGNVVNPDDIVAEHGADTLRLYEMFLGPLADSKPWSTRDIPGCRRFLERVWRLVVDPEGDARARPERLAPDPPGEPEGEAAELERALARMLKRVEDSFRELNLNTAVAAFMSFANEVQKRPAALRRSQLERFLAALAPFAPHIAEELWSRLGHAEPIALARWPEAEARWLVEESQEYPVQVLGKLRGRIRAATDAAEDEVVRSARAAVAAQLEGREVLRVVFVRGKLVNFVIR